MGKSGRMLSLFQPPWPVSRSEEAKTFFLKLRPKLLWFQNQSYYQLHLNSKLLYSIIMVNCSTKENPIKRKFVVKIAARE